MPLLRWHVLSFPFSGALVVAIAFLSSRCAGCIIFRLQTSILRPQTLTCPYAKYVLQTTCSLCCLPLLRWHMLSGLFSGALVVAIAFVESRCTGWTDSRLRTSIRRPRTCYLQRNPLNRFSHCNSSEGISFSRGNSMKNGKCYCF